MRTSKVLIKLSLIALVGCNQKGDFYEVPEPAAIEYGQVQTSAVTGADWKALSVFDIGRKPFGSMSKTTVYAKNLGDLPAAITKVWVESEHLEFFQLEHKCNKPLASQNFCPIHVTYSPNTVGSTPAVIHVAFSDGSGTSAEKSIPITATASNLAFLKFEYDSMDVKTNTVGYTLSSYFKVLYNGSLLAANGLSIEPAKGFTISDPTDGSFKIDRTNSTCGEIIQSDCMIKVDFSPLVTGPSEASFNVNYFNGAEVLKLKAESTGTGLQAAVLADLSASAVDFGNVVMDPVAPVALSVPVVFSGSVPADDIVIKGPADNNFAIDFSKTKTTCGSQITGNCVIYVTFDPDNLVQQSDYITIDYKSNGQPRTSLKISLKGKGVQPALISSDAQSLAYGSNPAFKTITKKFNLTNIGEVALSQLSALTFSDAVNYSGSFETKCSTLAAKAACILTVNYRSKTDSLANGSVSFKYFDGRATQNVSLSMSGTGTAPLAMEGSRTIDFGNVMIGNATLPASLSTSIAIYGMTALTNASQLVINPTALTSPFGFTPASTPGTTSNCRAPLDPKKANSCAFGVSLLTNALSPDVAITQNFSISYNGDGNNGAGVLSFIAKVTPRLPPVLAFGAVPAIKTVSVKDSVSVAVPLKNNSAYFATGFKSIGIEGSNAFSVSANGCSGGVVASASCNISVKFSPTEAGTFTGKLKYVYSDQIKDQTVYVDLSAVGSSDVTLMASATTVDFGSVYVGDAIAAKTIDLKYFGENDWTNTITNVSPFTVTPVDCGTPKDCKLRIEYAPSSAGTSSSVSEMIYSPALNKPGSIKLTLKGVASLRVPTITVTPAAIPKTLVGSQSSQVLTIKNTGNTTAEAIEFEDLQGVLSFTNDGAPGSSGNCAVPQSLRAGESCSVKISFTPNKVGKQEIPFNLSYGLVSPKLKFSTKLSVTGTQMIQVFAGGFQTCIINEVAQVICWGRNSAGQLGQGSVAAISKKPNEIPVVKFEADVVPEKLSVGDAHTCAIVSTSKAPSQVVCWGSNANGRLGIGSSTAQMLQPTNNKLLSSVNLGTDESGYKEEAQDIAAGFEHTCALTKTGKVKCWGGNTSGQLGNENSINIGVSQSQMDALKSVNLGRKAVSISAGAGHSCAVLEDGSSKCWGDNFYGQLGAGNDDEKIGRAPADISNLSSINLGSGFFAKKIFASSGAFTCALSNAGDVKCFGKTVADESSTKPFYSVLGSCWARAAQNSNAVSCSSDAQMSPTNSLGYLASDMGSSLNKVVVGNSSVDQISVGSSFTCALTSDQQVKCWGLNDQGQLGIGSRLNVGENPSEMLALKPAITSGEPVQIATGYEHACAVMKNNSLRCWGSSSLNATGLAALGVSGSSGVSPATAPMYLPLAYDGR
jgi:alpha-tubulin suppressor-like RCC1 family protein